MGALERYNERKKNSKTEKTSSKVGALQRYEMNKKYANVQTDNVNDAYINSFLSEAGNFLGNTKAEENSYNAWKDLSAKANTIKAWTWKNRNNLTEDSYKALNESLNIFDSAGEYWNQFASPEDYTNYFNEQKNYYDKWGHYADAEDYAENSKYTSTKYGDPQFNAFAKMYTDTGFKDLTYDYINKNEEAVGLGTANDALLGLSTIGMDRSYLKEMSDSEIGIYNYLYSTQGKEAAQEYISDLTSNLNARQRAKSEEYWKNYAKESPVLASTFSVLTSPLKGISYLGQATDYIEDGKIDQNAGYNKFSYSNSAIRNEVSKDMSGVGSFLYNTGMSMGDFLLTTGITGGNSAMALTIMGTGAAADTVVASKDMGLSDNQAFILGTAAGAIEAATEKIGLDAMLDKKLLGESVGKYILKNVLAEGLEEGLSNVGNTTVELIDLAFSGDESKIKREIQAIMQEQGVSESEAVGKYVGGKFKDLGLDVLGGALSGGVIGGGSVGMQAGINYADKIFNKKPTVQQPIAKASSFEQTTTEPDTLEKAAMDVVNNRNTAQQAENKPQTAFESKVNQIPTFEETTPTSEKNASISDTELQSILEETAKEKALADEKANKAAFDAGKMNVPREQVKLTTEAQEEAYNAGRVEHIKNMPSEKTLQNVNENSDGLEYNVSKSDFDVVDVSDSQYDNYGVKLYPKTNLSDAEISQLENALREKLKGVQNGNEFAVTTATDKNGQQIISVTAGHPIVLDSNALFDDVAASKTAKSGKSYSDLAEKLRTHNRADTEHLVFRVSKVGEKWQGKIDAAEMDAGGGYMVSNARGLHYASDLFNAREEAVADILAVATNNKLLGGVAQNNEQESGTTASVNTTNNDSNVQEENTNVRAEETVNDTDNTEHQRGNEENDSREKGSNTERIQRKIEEILRKSTSDRNNRGFNDLDEGKESARLEQKETAEAFEERAYSDGYRYVTLTNGKSAIAYKIAPNSEWNENANKANEVLTGLGFTVIVFDGELRSNSKGVSQVSSEATTFGIGDNLTIFVSSELSIDGLETAYHEAFHALRRNGLNNVKHHYKMIDTIASGVDVESEAFEQFVSDIVELYSYNVRTVANERFATKVTEEFYAWYIGSIYATKNEHSIDMLTYIKEFSRPNNIKPQLDAIFAEIKSETTLTKESANDVHEGVLDGESNNNNEVRQSEPAQKTEEERNAGTEDRQLGKDVAVENGTDVQASEEAKTSEGSNDSGDNDNGVRESDNGDGDGGVGTRGNDNVDEVKARDFSITKAVAEELDTKAPSLDDNINAIKLLQDLEASGKAPTKAQQAILAKFKGWGGLANAFWRDRSRLKEIMTDAEISAAQSTVNDAYFTPTSIIDGVYKALEHLGFEGGNVLEPSMGVGNFFGRMPKSIKSNSSLFGVEIDTISGRIAQHLYPSAKIEISPFQDVAYKDGAFDLIIGNVPFGEVKYKYKNNKYLIHDYFFIKAMDKLNDGGVMAFLTSRGTLDKIDSRTRAELARQGNIIAAYRLPSTVFTKSASASVVTDLIILQKSANTNGERFTNLGNINITGEDFSINEYFVNHPENIIGQLTKKWNYRSQKYEIDVKATGDVAEQLAKAVKKLPKGLLSGAQTVGSIDVTENTAALQTFSVKENGVVEYIDAQTGDVKQLKGKNAETAKAYIKLNTAYQALIDSTLADAGTAVVESHRKELNTLYDDFVKKYGTLEKNKKILAVDNDFVKLSGLEVYDTKTKSIIKSEMFTKDTLGKRKPKKADNALDALSISIGESGGVNIDRIAELTSLSESEVIKQLSDRIVYTPDGTYELNEVYLSGNVREKYEAVKGKKGFEKNEQMLKDVIPEDIPAKNITPQFGSPWIAPKYVAEFLESTFHLYRSPTVSYDATTGTWSISGDSWGDHTLLTSKYGTKYIDALKLADKALNMRKIVVKNNDGVVLVGETRAAQQKAEDIKAAFEEWCFKDAKRRQELVTTFNEKFNSHRNMDFSELAKYLTFDGLTETFKLRDYQKRAVARAIFNGNTLLAHGVGTGKTAEMIAIAMELKRMGIAKKNMMVVPNHKVADFRNDILKMYPSAKVIMLEKGANGTQRQRFYAQVAANDFDIVVIPHSSFGMLDVSDDTKTAFISNQLAELEEVMTQTQQEQGRNIDNRFIRQLENQKKRLEEKLKQITESKKDIGNTFEELGVDSLFVDEAHNFKNLPFYSKLSRVAGVSVNQSNNKTRASRAENMFMITDYLNRNNGRITFGTATPITNSMSEIYNMIRFLRPDILADAGIQSFDAWASMFGSIVNQAEVDPSGRKFRMKERFSKFKNVAQMVEQFRRMADILKTGDVIQELPKAERIDVINESNEIQEEFLDIVDKMIDEIRSSGQNAQHNMLEVTTAGQMAAVDLRFVESYFEGRYTREDLNIPNNRIARVAEKVIKEYNDSNDRKGTQFVFCDVGIRDDSTKKYNLHVYGDLINRLVAGGIPKGEIAVAQDFEDKADLSAKVNTGEIRVLIGSTAVMGEGMNAQNKAVALHHMTVPYRPSDIEQREGRIIRYGNENKNIRIYRYIQEKSYDSYQWQMQERKASFINQALSGGSVEELEEMSDFQLTAREAKAIASGNPLLLEKIEVEDKLNKLKSLRNKFNVDKREMQDRLAMLPTVMKNVERIIADTEADINTINANETKDFEITFGKTKFTERAEAAKALEKAISKAPRNGSKILIGSYKGLDLYYTSTIANGTKYIIKGAKEYTVEAGESSLGNITRIINAVEKIPSGLETAQFRLNNIRSELETLKKEVEAEFPQAKELDELQTKLNDIDTQLGINVSEVDMSDVVVGEEDDDTDSFIEGDAEADSMWSTTRVGENKKPKSLSTIIAEIEHDFGINITTGHIRGKGVLGKYDVKSGGIRTKIANNLPIVSHELGHHFERTFGIKEQLTEEMTKELTSQLTEIATEKYSDEQLIREGVAEYIRRFLQNRETAAIDYPLFTDFFLKCFTAKDLARFEQLADDINAYYSLDADTATSSIRLREEGGIDLRTPVEKLKDTASTIYQALIDSNHAIKRFDRSTGSNAYMYATNAAYSDAIAGQIVTGDLTDKDGKYISSGLKTVLNGIDLNNKEEYRLFGEYLVVKHGPERLKEGMRVFADDRKNSTSFMERRQAELEAQYPQFEEVSERLYDFIKKFYQTWGVDTGLISGSMLESWGERWEFYVPFNRAVEKGKNNYGAKRGFANQNSTIKKAKGGGQDIYNPVDNLIDNIVKMVNAGVRNNVMLTIADSAEKLGADATFLEKVPMPLSVTKMDMTGVKDQLTNWLEESDLDEKSKIKAEGVVNNLDDILLQYGRGKAGGNVITVLKNGAPQAWKINDADLLKSLTSLSPKTMDGIWDAYAVVSRFMTANITGNNIVWSIFSNLPRDFGTFFTYSKNKNVVKMAKGVGSAYLNKVKGDSADPLYKEFLAMGGGKTSAYTADRNLTKDIRKKLSDRKFNPNPLDWIGFASDIIEAGPRFATYKMMREAGMTPQEAFYEAMDITTNFRRSGSISKELNKGVPFFNASVQGLDKFRRWITAEEYSGTQRKKAIRGRVISYVAVSAAIAAIFYALNNGDDEKEKEYEQLSTYTKNSYWVIPVGDGKYFAVPKPREIGVLSSFFERCMEYGVGENDHAFDEFYAYASENFLPAIANDIAQIGQKGLVETFQNIIGSFGLLGVFGYLGANRDFLGRPIVSSGLQNLEPKDQYTDRTSKIAYWLGQAFNGSPEQIDYFMQQVLGGWWKYQKALFPVGEKNVDWTLGVGNTYIKDSQYSTDLTNWLYDRADATAKAKNSDPNNIDKAIIAKLDSNMTDFYGTYYKKAKEDSNSTAENGTRQLVLDMIREYQKGIDGGYKTEWQKAVEAVCVEKGSTEYLPAVMSGEVTDGEGNKHDLSDVQYVEYQTDYLRLYWETVEETMSSNLSTEAKANILEAAKTVAKERATERTLQRIGATTYENKPAIEAEEFGINTKLYITASVEMANIKADVDQNGKSINGSRKEKIQRYLNSVCGSYKEYLFLLAIEYPSVKNDPDYIAYFGK